MATNKKNSDSQVNHVHNEHCDHDHIHEHSKPAWADQIIEDEILELEIPWEKLAKPYQNTLNRASKNLKIDGFRKGKVPAHIAKESLNNEYLVKETLRQVIGEFYNEKLTASKLKPVSDPEFVIIEADENQTWKISAHLAVRPKIELKDHKKFLESAKAEAKKEIKAQNEKIAKEKKSGDSKDDKSTAKAPEMTEEQINNLATDQALNKLHAKFAPQVNRLIVTRQASKELEQLLNQLKQFNLELEDYLKNSGQDQASFSDNLMASALNNLQMEFLLDAIIEAEKFTVSDEELKTKLTELSPEVKDAKAQEKLLADPYTKSYVEALAKRQKLADWLISL